MNYNDKQQSVYVGKKLTIEIFGASHAEEIGVKITGLQGQAFSLDEVNSLLNRRKAKKTAYSTKRLEEDKVIVKSGSDEECFVAVIKNTAQRSTDYDNTVKKPRPSHADYVAWSKYGDGYDYRGGGKFSGRLTAPMCIAGGIAKELLKRQGIEISAYISSIGKVEGKSYNDIDVDGYDYNSMDESFPLLDNSNQEAMQREISRVAGLGDSVGGKIECVVRGVPVGVGEYMFDSIESTIAHLAFAVPAVKGIEFGLGFDVTRLNGSTANDGMYYDDGVVKTYTNNNGGINGGIANGMPITFRVAIKPTPSIAIEQRTVDMVTKTNTTIKIQGRHDACIVPRAVPVIEAITAIAIYDIL